MKQKHAVRSISSFSVRSAKLPKKFAIVAASVGISLKVIAKIANAEFQPRIYLRYLT